MCLHLLPPYSPELNLVEILWHKFSTHCFQKSLRKQG
ncbi:MAG: transposase [Methylobacter sp.]|nr:transposase [Methylobacter sp.]